MIISGGENQLHLERYVRVVQEIKFGEIAIYGRATEEDPTERGTISLSTRSTRSMAICLIADRRSVHVSGHFSFVALDKCRIMVAHFG